MLTKEIKKSIDESILCWLATVDSQGVPNCSPKEVFGYKDDSEMVIANIASPVSVKNLKFNPNVCVSFVHVLKQKGYKLKGVATYLTPQSEDYSQYFQVIAEMVGDTFPVKGLVCIKIESAAPIIAPSYYLVSGTTEQSQIESVRQAYSL